VGGETPKKRKKNSNKNWKKQQKKAKQEGSIWAGEGKRQGGRGARYWRTNQGGELNTDHSSSAERPGRELQGNEEKNSA